MEQFRRRWRREKMDWFRRRWRRAKKWSDLDVDGEEEKNEAV